MHRDTDIELRLESSPNIWGSSELENVTSWPNPRWPLSLTVSDYRSSHSRLHNRAKKHQSLVFIYNNASASDHGQMVGSPHRAIELRLESSPDIWVRSNYAIACHHGKLALGFTTHRAIELRLESSPNLWVRSDLNCHHGKLVGSPHTLGATELRFESSPLSEYNGIYIVMANLPNIGELTAHWQQSYDRAEVGEFS